MSDLDFHDLVRALFAMNIEYRNLLRSRIALNRAGGNTEAIDGVLHCWGITINRLARATAQLAAR